MVTSTSDLVNGDVSSPASLLADPGPDGISLREAVEAANAVEGPHDIRFSETLAGQTIHVGWSMEVRQDGVSIVGFREQDAPAVTLDGSTIPLHTDEAIILIHASGFRIAHLRFTGTKTDLNTVKVQAGPQWLPPHAPNSVANVRIEDNVFDNTGFEDQSPWAPIRVKTADDLAVGTTIDNLFIRRNRFINFEEGIVITAAGQGVTYSKLFIEDNSVTGAWLGIEVSVPAGSGNLIRGTRIRGNTFVDCVVPIYIVAIGIDEGPATDGNTIQDTVIERNVIIGEWDSIGLTGGQNDGESRMPVNNQILDTEIVNNVVFAKRGISIFGGQRRTTGNRVSGVRIINNTIVIAHHWGAIRAYANDEDASGNSIGDVIVVNTVAVNEEFPEGCEQCEHDIAGDLGPDDVRSSLTSTPRFVGINGNISGDPLLVDRSGGDFHLQAGSPAIDAGTSDSAPFIDVDGNPRPQFYGWDIGASEFMGGGSCSARRSLGSYWPETTTTVSIAVSPPSGTASYVVEDRPPTGWAVSDISHSGSFADGVVQFGPFPDDQERTLTYAVTPPAGVIGAHSFSGLAFFDGQREVICKDQEITPWPPPRRPSGRMSR